MRTAYRRLPSLALFAIALFPTLAHGAAAADNAPAVVITFKDGHQQSFPVADIARIEFKNAGKSAATSIDLPTRHHFVGKWRVGDQQGHKYMFTLLENGQATNDVDSGGHGTWTYVNGEAHISWDNGWHDVLRKVDMKYMKFAFSPGVSTEDNPSNVGEAHKDTEPL